MWKIYGNHVDKNVENMCICGNMWNTYGKYMEHMCNCGNMWNKYGKYMEIIWKICRRIFSICVSIDFP